MFKIIKRLFFVLRCVSLDTHLWCVSVFGGAVVLCISFFVVPSQRQFIDVSDDAQSFARQIVIEYSSVLGGLSGIESLRQEEVEEIVEAIPVHSDVIDDADTDDIVKTDNNDKSEAYKLGITLDEFFEDIDDVSFAGTAYPSVDVSKTWSFEAVDALERLVQSEASVEDIDGRILVADVVLNRVDTGIWGDDIVSVIESPGQFIPVSNGSYDDAEPDSVTKEAVLSALLGEDNSHGAIYFQKSAARSWDGKEYLFRHGSHSFYR